MATETEPRPLIAAPATACWARSSATAFPGCPTVLYVPDADGVDSRHSRRAHGAVTDRQDAPVDSA
jgi:hypothetical protein